MNFEIFREMKLSLSLSLFLSLYFILHTARVFCFLSFSLSLSHRAQLSSRISRKVIPWDKMHNSLMLVGEFSLSGRKTAYSYYTNAAFNA